MQTDNKCNDENMYKELQKLKEWGNNKIYTSVKVSMQVRKARVKSFPSQHFVMEIFQTYS